MKWTHLEWDSNFFGKQIGRIDFEPEDAEPLLIEELKAHEPYDLIYIFAHKQRLLKTLIADSRCRLVDQKIIYSLLTANDHKPFALLLPNDCSIELYQESFVTKDLYDLAYKSGEYSRFKIDPKFTYDDFKKLYGRWIENSVTSFDNNFLFVCKHANQVNAMITMRCEKEIAIIGLLAVSNQWRGMNLGSALLNYAGNQALSCGAKRIEVATQAANSAACKLYEKNHFVKHDSINIYHYWLS